MSLTVKDFSDTLSILTDFHENPNILVAFSGGCDSLALLSLCVEVLGKEHVSAVYVNHKIRSERELDREIKLNCDNCRKLGVKLSIIELNREELDCLSVQTGTEAAARFLRYREIEKFAKENKFDFIATAHHFDDQIETLLMRVVSNAPAPSFRGIAPRRGNIIRPLLEYRKSQLEHFVKELNFSWSTDSTNQDNSIQRNEIRNVIIPGLKKKMPDYESRLLNLRSKAFKLCLEDERTKLIMKLYEMWDEKFDTRLPQTLIERVLNDVENNISSVESANGGTFCIRGTKIVLVDENDNGEYKTFTTEIPQTECKIALLDGKQLIVSKTPLNDKTLGIDFGKAGKSAKLRYVRTGDCIALKDGKKRVLRLLQDMKVPSVLRCRVPVMVDGDEVLAVFGSAQGGRDRLCAKLRSSIADINYYLYIKDTDTQE